MKGKILNFLHEVKKIISVLAKEGALGQMSKNFQVYFTHIIFFKKPNKKIYNIAKELYCDATIFVFGFFIVCLPKKNGNWKMAQVCWLSSTHELRERPDKLFVQYMILNIKK